MSYINDILLDKDRRIKVYVDGVAVSASILQSIYSRFPNFLNHFIVSQNTLPVSGVKTYDISLKYPYKSILKEANVAKGTIPRDIDFNTQFDVLENVTNNTYEVSLQYPYKSIPKEGNVVQGTIPRDIDYNDIQFDVSENVTNNTYEISNTAWGKVLVDAFTTPRKLAFTGTAVTSVVEDIPNDKITLTLTNTNTDTNDQVIVFLNGVQVGAEPARLNLSSDDFTATRNSVAANDWVDIALKGGSLPSPLGKHYGIYRWAGAEDGHKEGIFSGITLNDEGGGTTDIGIDADGVFVNWETGSDDNDYIELSCSPDFMTRRDFNPHLYGKIKIMTNSFRFFSGFHDNDPLPEDDNAPLDNTNGFGFSYTTDGPDSTTYQIRRNNAAAAESKTNTALTFGTGTLVSFHIWATTAGGWFWSVNNGAASAAITAAVPAATTPLSFTTRLEEIAGNEQTIQLYYLYYLADK